MSRAPRPLSCLGVSRATGLSSLVIVPLLVALVDDGTVDRSPDPTGSWAYRLTARGHRELRRRTPPGGPRIDPLQGVDHPRAG